MLVVSATTTDTSGTVHFLQFRYFRSRIMWVLLKQRLKHRVPKPTNIGQIGFCAIHDLDSNNWEHSYDFYWTHLDQCLWQFRSPAGPAGVPHWPPIWALACFWTSPGPLPRWDSPAITDLQTSAETGGILPREILEANLSQQKETQNHTKPIV